MSPYFDSFVDECEKVTDENLWGFNVYVHILKNFTLL